MNRHPNQSYSGWDIGGAHLKLARSDQAGRLQQVIQLPCPLWQGIDALESSLRTALDMLDNRDDMHAITMTGELVDAFVDREQGVTEILDCLQQRLPTGSMRIFAGLHGWLAPEQAAENWQQVASMNWQAGAMLVAESQPRGLFVDIGSTTCDIVPISAHRICPQGWTDHARQRHGELVYSGAIRTPLMAICDSTMLAGERIPLTAEWFASSADIWRLLGVLEEHHIQDDSADGRPWDEQHCRQRLARMLATDAAQASDAQWRGVASWFAEKQLQTLTEACLQVLSHHPELDDEAPFIAAGVGHELVARVAARLARPCLSFGDFCCAHPDALLHAPAAALALMAQRQFT